MRPLSTYSASLRAVDYIRGEVVTVHRHVVTQLNCGTFTPFPGIAPFITRVLLVPLTDGYALVDTGLGTRDIERPRARLGIGGRLFRPSLEPAETAKHQLDELGIDTSDVKHIVATHLDFDHISGIDDFPKAALHVLLPELQAATNPRGRSVMRYRKTHYDRFSEAITYEPTAPAENVLGLNAIPVRGVEGLWLTPMPGHTPGHSAVIVENAGSWIVHAGDALFHRASLGVAPKSAASRVATVFEQVLAADRSSITANHAALQSVSSRKDVQVVCSHDSSDWSGRGASYAERGQDSRNR